MTARVTCRLPRTAAAAPCSRCLDIIDVQAGHWISTEISDWDLDGPRAVCDRCAQRDDPAGWRAVKAWRRAAAGPATGSSSSTGSSSRDPWAS
jgi:hypothetical protein